MRLTQEVIDDIRNSADIVDVIGHYIPLVKKGKGYSALCPFHDDHDPSLSISQDKQIYKCFVCGNGGNVFSFVSNFKKISFPEAVAEVASIIGKPIEIDTAPKKVSRFQPYYDLLSAMISYCNYLLSASKLGEDAMAYLGDRGLEKDVIEYFNIGLDPDNRKIYEYLKNHNFKDEDMIKCGVCRMLDNGMADVFYNRIIFPIHDREGNPIAFTARDYRGNSTSKYINSSDNILYTKGDHLYNYHRAFEASRKAGYVLVCEGVMDVIAYFRAGKDNVVATLGTACTSKQVELLASLNRKIVLSYDGDRAGQAANMKIGEILLNKGLEVSVIDNDTELDPDEIIKEYGKNALRDLEAKQISYIDYAFKFYRKQYNLDNYDDRKKMTLRMSELIEKLTDEYDKENYLNELYEITKIRRRVSQNTAKIGYNNKTADISFSIDGLTKAEYLIISQIAMSKKALDIYQRQLGCLLDENDQKLAMLIIDDYRKHEKCSLSRIFDESQDDEIRNLITSLALLETLPSEYDEKSLMGAIDKVKLEIKYRKMEDLKDRISKISTVDPEKAFEYLREYEDLIRELGGK
ncbi:MAG: DNA primase [Erysipelotrichaceae bacterium]|jgi:DNA primase|nr:DNA primase [Erysipelotrichaceae bacterium]